MTDSGARKNLFELADPEVYHTAFLLFFSDKVLCVVINAGSSFSVWVSSIYFSPNKSTPFVSVN